MGIYSFDHDHEVPARELTHLLGGKGAGLAEMTTALGINVPPGFTVALDVCGEYRDLGWPAGLDEELAAHVDALGDRMGRHLRDPDDPLLVAVRSGAPVSMPGMLDTILNLGLNEDTVKGLARVSGDEWFAYDSYRRFLSMFATTVMGVKESALELGPPGDTARSVQDHVVALRARITEVAGREVPTDPQLQLHEAVEAVLRSWDCDRAQAYRAKEGIDEGMGTAVNVQAMVFGNRGARSGTGVVFTRNPSTGDPGPFGDYLPRAQGEDVVAGTAHTMPIIHLSEHLPEVYDELLGVLRRLEVHYRDVCDIEFTLEDGRLWLLQTRVGKRGAVAAVRIAVDMATDPEIGLSPSEAVDRVPAAMLDRARAEVLARASGGANPVTTGLGASPGRVTGRVVLTSERAVEDEDPEVPQVLVRAQTSPEDVAGMAACAGILTTRGGLVSHAAVVARGWGIPAVVGASELTLTDRGLHLPDGRVLAAGDAITIDGATGEVWLGEVAGTGADPELVLASELPELARLEAWAADATTPPTYRPRSVRMKIAVDYDKCTALGICESLAPDFFEVDDEGDLQVLRADVPEDQRELVEQAVAGCPTGALRLVE